MKNVTKLESLIRRREEELARVMSAGELYDAGFRDRLGFDWRKRAGSRIYRHRREVASLKRRLRELQIQEERRRQARLMDAVDVLVEVAGMYLPDQQILDDVEREAMERLNLI